jgi:microcystin-dependent protein
MTRLRLALLLLLGLCSAASALTDAQIPAKFPIPWGASAGGAYIRPIPQSSQIGVQAGAASLTDGFPPVTFLPVGAGGTPPFGQDFNGILNQITLWNQWQQAGGPVKYDSAFSASVGGYPQGATIASATFGYVWLSLVDNNSTNPDAGGANWQQVSLIGFTTGDVKATLKTTADPGWVMLNDGSIGSAGSGATTRANADTQALYVLIWNNVSNSYAPVVGGRGASAATDFAANKAMTLPLALGRALASAGAGAGLTAYALGQTTGENTHTMSLGELVAHSHSDSHSHTITGPSGSPTGGGSGSIALLNFGTGATAYGSTNVASGFLGTTGSTTPFNQMQPTTFVNFMVRL